MSGSDDASLVSKKSKDISSDSSLSKYKLSQSSASSSAEEKASISEVAAALSGNESSLELKNGKLVSDDKANSMSFTQYSDS